jgi:hypothetical protein
MEKMIAKLNDTSGNGATTVEVTVEKGSLGLILKPKGASVCGAVDCGPIFLELHKGKLRLLVWASITQEEPTHIIDLDGALECRG